jgi:hypothetical protein
VRTLETQPTPKVTAADVDRVVERDYPPDQHAEVLATLQRYGKEDWHREADRVRLAALKLAAGSLDQLRLHIDIAAIDYRDVLAAAEYPAYMKREPHVDNLPQTERAEIIEDDWKQYQRWLGR